MNTPTAVLAILAMSGFQLVSTGHSWLKSPRLTTYVSTPPPTPAPTTIQGCTYEGNIYRFGEYFGGGYDPDSNWCYGMYCSNDGSVLFWDDFNCYPTQTTMMTTHPTTPGPTPDMNGGAYRSERELLRRLKSSLHRLRSKPK